MSHTPMDGAPPEDCSTTLLLAPSLRPADGSRCIELLASEWPAHVVSVTLTDTPVQRLAVWERYADATPDSAVIIAVGQESADTVSLPVPVERVDSAADLTRLGIVITEALEAGPPGRTTMCFRSLTALLQYADLDEVCQFLDALVPRIEAADARAHFHADPGALAQSTLETLTGRLDTVVDTREPTPGA